MADDAAGLAARQLGHVGVLLLRHDRRAGAEAVGELDEAEVLAHPEHQLLAEARDVHHAQAGRGGELDREVAVADRVDAVAADLGHAERLGHHLAVERVAGAGERGGAERQAIGAGVDLGHALGVAREHLDVGQQVMRERHRLGHLQVGEAGQDGLGVLVGELDQGALQLGQQRADAGDLVAQPEAHVGRDLVVARAAGVQALAGIAGELHQAGLDVEMHVLELGAPLEGAALDLGGDRREAGLDRAQVGGGDDALRRQHRRRGRGCRRCRRATGGGRRQRSRCNAGPARSSARRTGPTRLRSSCRTGWRSFGRGEG